MSVTIGEKKLKFHVLGNGFDEVRADSGEGAESSYKTIYHGADYAVIDSTGQYFWLCQNSGGFPLESCGKRRIDTLEEVSQSAVPNYNNKITCVFHPTNVENDYGIAIQTTDIYLFNLTDDTLYGHTTYDYYIGTDFDAVLIDHYIYFVARNFGRNSKHMYRLDINDMTFIDYATSPQRGIGGFVDDDTVYGFESPEWFSDYKKNIGYSRGFVGQWSVTATASGSSGFPNLNQSGMCGKGKLYLPSYVNGAWRFGVYNGNRASDFTTPKPMRTFGKFSSIPDFVNAPVYSDLKDYSAFKTTEGTYVTNYNECELITKDYWIPLAVNDHYVIARDRYSYNVRVFKYR